jgi:hypothetical protein
MEFCDKELCCAHGDEVVGIFLLRTLDIWFEFLYVTQPDLRFCLLLRLYAFKKILC